MNHKILRRFGACLSLSLLLLFATACVTSYSGPPVAEQSRLFFARQRDTHISAGASVDEIAQSFAPEAAVRESIEQFGRQGYVLAEIHPLRWSDGATMFIFSKELSRDEIADRPPIHFIGVFVTQSEKPQPTYYVFTQREKGYRIRVMGPQGIENHNADWAGRDLEWEDSDGIHHAELSTDSQKLFIATQAKTEEGSAKKEWVTAERVVEHQEPDSDDIREARRHLYKLHPQTPRDYDPFPW